MDQETEKLINDVRSTEAHARVVRGKLRHVLSLRMLAALQAAVDVIADAEAAGDENFLIGAFDAGLDELDKLDNLYANVRHVFEAMRTHRAMNDDE